MIDSTNQAGRPTARRAIGVWATGLLLLALPARPESAPELVTDRPDQTESAVVVPARSVQIEVGWTLQRDGGGDRRVETQAVPGTLVRIGLAAPIELRLGWSGVLRERSGGRSADGAGDAELGAKVRLRDGNGGGPHVAALVSTSLPVGDDAFSSGRADPALRLAIDHALGDRLGLGYNLGIGWETAVGDDGRRHTLSRYLYTVALGIDLNARWGAFVELYGDLPASQPEGAAHRLDGGVTLLINDRLQLDAAAGIGLNDAAEGRFVGLGVSLRVPR